MRSTLTSYRTISCLLIIALLAAGFTYTSNAADNREYEISVEPYKTDTVRLIEAYERLSDQYLSLVQHHLKNMETTDKQILTELKTLESKLDALTAKVDKLTEEKTPPTQSTDKSNEFIAP